MTLYPPPHGKNDKIVVQTFDNEKKVTQLLLDVSDITSISRVGNVTYNKSRRQISCIALTVSRGPVYLLNKIQDFVKQKWTITKPVELDPVPQTTDDILIEHPLPQHSGLPAVDTVPVNLPLKGKALLSTLLEVVGKQMSTIILLPNQLPMINVFNEQTRFYHVCGPSQINFRVSRVTERHKPLSNMARRKTNQSGTHRQLPDMYPRYRIYDVEAQKEYVLELGENAQLIKRNTLTVPSEVYGFTIKNEAKS